MSYPDDDQHRYTKDKDGIKIELTDPIQDIMSDDELKEAENTLLSLIDKSNSSDSDHKKQNPKK
jgi:hypothetical protein